MTEAEQEKIADYRKRREDILRILDDIVEIIRFQDRPEDAILEQKLEEIRKILAQNSGCLYCKSKGKPNKKFTDEKSLVCIGFVDVYVSVSYTHLTLPTICSV